MRTEKCVHTQYASLTTSLGCEKYTFDKETVSNINKNISLENIVADSDCQHGFRSQRSCETQLVHSFMTWIVTWIEH